MKISLKTGTLGVLLAVLLSACVGVGPQGTGDPMGTSAPAAPEAGPALPDEALNEDQPHPGGVSAPLNEIGRDTNRHLALRGSVSRCVQPQGEEPQGSEAVETRWAGRLVMVSVVDGSETPPSFNCFGRYLRVTENEGDALECKDLMLEPDCTVDQDFDIADPATAGFYLSNQVINLLNPKPHPDCGPVLEGGEADFVALVNEFDFTGLFLDVEDLPACNAEIHPISRWNEVARIRKPEPLRRQWDL